MEFSAGIHILLLQWTPKCLLESWWFFQVVFLLWAVVSYGAYCLTVADVYWAYCLRAWCFWHNIVPGAYRSWGKSFPWAYYFLGIWFPWPFYSKVIFFLGNIVLVVYHFCRARTCKKLIPWSWIYFLWKLLFFLYKHFFWGWLIFHGMINTSLYYLGG